jgi:hypothetical protein
MIRAEDQDYENGAAVALATANAQSLWQAVSSYLGQPG